MTQTLLQVGDQVRLRRRGGAVARVYTVSDIVSRVGVSPRLLELESDGGATRTAWEDDLVLVQPAVEVSK